MKKCVEYKINETKYTKKCGKCLQKELIYVVTGSEIIATNWDIVNNGKIL